MVRAIEAKKLIRLTAPEEVQEFVSAAASCEFDVDLKYNRIIVDAKSFLGVLSLLSHPVMVFCQGENSRLNGLLEKYAVC